MRREEGGREIVYMWVRGKERRREVRGKEGVKGGIVEREGVRRSERG